MAAFFSSGRHKAQVLDPGSCRQVHERFPMRTGTRPGCDRRTEEILDEFAASFARLDPAGVRIKGSSTLSPGESRRCRALRNVHPDAHDFLVFSLERKVPAEHRLLGFGVEHEGGRPREHILHDPKPKRRLVMGRGDEGLAAFDPLQAPVGVVIKVGEKDERGRGRLPLFQGLEEGAESRGPAVPATPARPSPNADAKRSSRNSR